MSHPIIMTWKNIASIKDITFEFRHAAAREGTLPTANPSSLGPSGTSSVSADQTGNLRPGPVGSYDWVDATDANRVVAVSYIHPAGAGQSSVTVSCSAKLEIEANGNGKWYSAHTFTDESLQHHDALITLAIREVP